ncbi:MAG: long-chain fatty acid--CoA ligase [Sandaracinaceae bacterium]|nr:long-chain fatty acid--CoA ligase [Sandaracinaceae bacterium]
MTTAGTMLARIEGWAARQPDAPALHDRRADGSWEVTTYAGWWRELRRIGKGLIALGVAPGDCVAIVGANRADWLLSQHGINAAQAIPAPLYATLLAEQMAYIIDNAQAKVAICDDREQLAKMLRIADERLAPLEHVVTMDELGVDDPRVLSLAALKIRGDAIDDATLDARLDAVSMEDVALLIYTSGTTGVPKGAMFTHAGIEAIGKATAAVFPFLVSRDTTFVSYLPLCHAAEQGLTNFAGLMTGGAVYFCRDIAQIKDHLAAVRPTVFLAVPRVWEKFEAALRGRMAEAKGAKGELAKWALATELAWFRRESAEGGARRSVRRTIANRLVISKIKHALGLDRLQLALSGAAPISTSTLEFFASLGIVIHEGYGMTETTAFASVQPYGRVKFGTIGTALPGVEVKIAADGEILLRGPNMVKGYYRLPDKSAELYDADGWMQTGDLGALDADGYVTITGRKKDLIITAGGKNVAPAELEGYLQAIDGVGQAVVVGDRQPYLAALLVLDPEALPALEAAAGVAGLGGVAAASRDPRVRAFLDEAIERECNSKVARYQTIKRFDVLDDVLSVDGGELTPTLKVKRDVIAKKYAGRIAALYAGGELSARS